MSGVYEALANLYIIGALLAIALAVVLLVAKKHE